jgi:predicted cytidylate kinase
VTKPLVALSGPPGSGKSTVGRRAAELLGLEFVSAGALFRAEAGRRGLDLAAFGALAERDRSVDQHLDETMVRLAEPGRLLDGRIVGALCRRAGRPVVTICVTATEEVRLRRIAERDHVDVETARRLTSERQESERRRYWKYYQIDLDQETPDLTIDSSELPPETVAARVVQFVRSHPSGRPS